MGFLSAKDRTCGRSELVEHLADAGDVDPDAAEAAIDALIEDGRGHAITGPFVTVSWRGLQTDVRVNPDGSRSRLATG